MLSVDSPDVKQGAAKCCGVLERAKSTLEMTQLRVDNAVDRKGEHVINVYTYTI
jgi:hypothetical protein